IYASDDPVFAEHLAQPAAAALAGSIEEHKPDVVLFPSSPAARDVAGRLQARTGSALVANVVDVTDPDHVRTQMGGSIVEVEIRGPSPRLILIRPKTYAAQETGGAAETVEVAPAVPDELKRARVVERHE